MLKGFYTAGAGMIAQQRRQEMLSNNLANANTPGYKADQGSLRAFPEMLMQSLNTEELPYNKSFKNSHLLGPINTGVYLQEAIPNFAQGDLQQTGIHTDIALQAQVLPINEETNRAGAIFFEVQNENGDLRYTRNGDFTLDGSGNLVTNEGFYVLDTQGNPIQIFGNDFTVNEDGTVLEGEVQIAQINIAYANEPEQLVKEGSTLFAVNGGGALESAIGNNEIVYSLRQGFVEGSNVDVQQTMTEMMTAYRTFEVNQRVLRSYDQSMEKAVNEVGRVR
ncbi:flagellar hook-basal body protein [Bacillus solimangrovi]|uniref:Flagellar biosynthesis protein FlgC n=1 Tax=Bacillus solimangrovi TaxID=1305675 RepID=A0A1E5LGY6_9BACI|nr:flagellar hook-basal body protein [Bacillus solimangrovi]OEH93340.1 flagellar biosynthesis protein FlgC [Bacillus solimangrovi]